MKIRMSQIKNDLLREKVRRNLQRASVLYHLLRLCVCVLVHSEPPEGPRQWSA